MKLLIVASGTLNKASTRVRVLNYIPFFRREGWEVRVIYPPVDKSFSSRLSNLVSIFRGALWGDVVLVQKKLFSYFSLKVLRVFSRRLVFDVDDPVFLNMNGSVNKLRKRLLDRILSVSDAVIVDNDGLRRYCSWFNRRTVLIPSCVDTSVYRPLPRVKGSGVFVIGWIGHQSNLSDLGILEPVFSSLTEKYGGRVVLKVVSGASYYSSSIRVINKSWVLEEEPFDIASFDIGVVPLSWSRWIEYKILYRPYVFMAMGCPVVISPFGQSAVVVGDGVGGFGAWSLDDWYRAIVWLMEDRQRVMRIGLDGRRKVERYFSYEVNFPDLREVILGG